MLKISTRLIIIALTAMTIVFFSISGRGCPKRNSKTKIGSSNPVWFLPAPSGLTAEAVSFSEIRLSWQDNSSEDGFEIERRSNLIDWQVITRVGANVTSYLNNGLVPLSTYYYRVRAFNLIGDNSDYSNEANATTLNMSWSGLEAGYLHTIALSAYGTIWSWGFNARYQLGLADTYDRILPIPVSTDIDWSFIASGGGVGGGHTIAIKTDGAMWGWGDNQYGELGFGDTTYDGDIPYPVGTDSDWSIADCGAWFTIAIKRNNTIWAWGANESGQLGLNDFTDRNVPTQIGTDSDWVKIALGYDHAIALRNNGTIWGWGYNSKGELGLGYVGGLIFTPTQIGVDSDWLAVSGTNLSTLAAGGEVLDDGTGEGDFGHSLAIKNNRTIWAWGYNANGQLGLGDLLDRNTPNQIGSDSDWSMVSAGGWHSSAMKINGTIWAWGYNQYGQCGLGDMQQRNTPSQVGTDSDWTRITAWANQTLALKSNGTIWGWGANSFGQLGLGDTINRNTPSELVIGIPHFPLSLIVTLISPSEILLTWVDLPTNEDGFKIERKTNANGTWNQIDTVGANITSYRDTSGVPPLTTYYYRVRAYNSAGDSVYSNEAWVSVSGNWSDVFAGNGHTIARKTDGSIWGWGNNYSGQLGLPDTNTRTTAIPIGTSTDWLTVAAGAEHNIARKINGTLWSWGYNWYGQLGLGYTNSKVTTLNPVGSDSDWATVTAMGNHNLARKTGNTIWSWGYNYYGQLGLGDSRIDRTTPTQIGTTSDWFIAVAGKTNCMVINASRTLWGWGTNWYGQLGLGYSGNAGNPADMRNYVNTPTQIGNASDWSLVAPGSYHTLSLKNNSSLWSWGFNDTGQLGLGDSGSGTERLTPTQVGIESDWSVIAAGGRHSIAMKINGSIWVWGQNIFGQLGQGDTTNRNTPTILGIDTDWVTVTTNWAHTLGLKINGILWAWGENGDGQLGVGDRIDRNVPTLVGE